jgi:hypothetical protein
MKWLNFDNCAIVNIRKGEIDAHDLEKNLNAIFCKHKKWPWQIREMTPKNFLVCFPPWINILELVDFPAFDLETEGVNIKIMEWDGDDVPLAELHVFWVHIKGIPPKNNAWKSFAAVITSCGILMDVDWGSFFKSF